MPKVSHYLGNHVGKAQRMRWRCITYVQDLLNRVNSMWIKRTCTDTWQTTSHRSGKPGRLLKSLMGTQKTCSTANAKILSGTCSYMLYRNNIRIYTIYYKIYNLLFIIYNYTYILHTKTMLRQCYWDQKASTQNARIMAVCAIPINLSLYLCM